MLFTKSFDKLSQCLLPSITKKRDVQPLIALQIQIFIKVFQYILKSIETFLIQNYVYNNTKKYKSDKKQQGQTLI